MTENKTNHEICTECHHPDKHENDCCCSKETNPHTNECMKCCEPLEFKCPDIRKATCVPILGERIYDFKCINKKQERAISNAVFEVILDGDDNPFTDGDKVCIEKISVKYDCLGFINGHNHEHLCEATSEHCHCDKPEHCHCDKPEHCHCDNSDSCSYNKNKLPIIIDSSATSLTASPLLCSHHHFKLYSSYSGSLTTKFLCCEEGRKVNLAQGPIQVGVSNLQYILKGKIGCVPFVATLDGPKVNDSYFTGVLRSFGDITLYNSVCLPQVESPVDIKADFQLEIIPKCVIPKSTYHKECNSFTANIFDCLSIKEKFYITVKDELVVYTAFNGLECEDDCHHYPHDFYDQWCKR